MKTFLLKSFAALAVSGGLLAEDIGGKIEIPSPKSQVPGGPFSITVTASEIGIKEKVRTAYLGVVTAPLGPQLRSQLDLPEGMGLSVEAVAKDSPAERAGIKQYDVLKKFNDQMLCSQEQLSVLVRAAGKDAKVILTVLRGGKEQTVSITLGEHEMPKVGKAQILLNGEPAFGIQIGDLDKLIQGGPGEVILPDTAVGRVPPSAGIQERFEEMRRMHERKDEDLKRRDESARSKKDGGPQDGEEQILSKRVEPGLGKAYSYYSGSHQGVVVVSDAEGTIELSETAGKKSVKITDPSGKEVFSGPLNTDEDRNAIPEKFRDKVKNAEGKIKNLVPDVLKKKNMEMEIKPFPATPDKDKKATKNLHEGRPI